MKDKAKVELQNEEVYMATTFEDFIQLVVQTARGGGGGGSVDIEYDAVHMHVNNMDISFPHQLFIDGKFVDCTNDKKLRSINPTDESLVCEVRLAKHELHMFLCIQM